jgi:hypothetical protein
MMIKKKRRVCASDQLDRVELAIYRESMRLERARSKKRVYEV